MWGQAARQNWIPHRIILSSSREFHSRAARGWQDVRGPAGAVVLTIGRLDWTIIDWHLFRARSGVHVDIRVRPSFFEDDLASECSGGYASHRARGRGSRSWTSWEASVGTDFGGPGQVT
eukprot:7429412-Pyramimonas_sp.AAC.1